MSQFFGVATLLLLIQTFLLGRVWMVEVDFVTTLGGGGLEVPTGCTGVKTTRG